MQKRNRAFGEGQARSGSRLYQTPRLVVYGALREMTSSGSVDRPEGSGAGNTTKKT